MVLLCAYLKEQKQLTSVASESSRKLVSQNIRKCAHTHTRPTQPIQIAKETTKLRARSTLTVQRKTSTNYEKKKSHLNKKHQL